MGILKKLANRVFGSLPKGIETKHESLRRCYFEVMEERRVLSASPVVAGITYREGDGGLDTQPDYFEVSFQGGSNTTQLTSFTINGDRNQNALRDYGDIFFDTNGIGAGGSFPFQFDPSRSVGVSSSDIASYTVSDDGLTLTVNLRNFVAGDIFAFAIDVDEMERFRPDQIVTGTELEATLFTAVFADQHYSFNRNLVELDINHSEQFVQHQWSGVFFDDYDALFAEGSRIAGGTLHLREDNWNEQANRTAGAIDVYELVPKPISISGSVYHDEDANCIRGASEAGIGNVSLTLQRLNEAGQYVNIANTQTDAQGRYRFGTELNLQPGTFRLIQNQPSGFLSVGAVIGSHGGQVTQDAGQHPNIIGNISIPLGNTHANNYDFCEVRPASISGLVWHDANDDGTVNAGEHGIANVLIQVTRTGAQTGTNNDVFASTPPIFVRTDVNGRYSVTGLPPGIYEIIEINNYPSETNPLTGYLDGKDALGTVGSAARGVKFNDRFAQVELRAGDAGVNYNFGELQPTSISGYVSLTTPEGNCVAPSDPTRVGIAGVRIELYDAGGNLVTSTLTNSQGRYEFNALRPGVYSVVEVQPAGYLDVAQKAGTVAGQNIGTTSLNRISNITLSSGKSGVNYNFCETVPAEICGTVWHDRNNDGKKSSSEEGIGSVVVQLFDKNGIKIAETVTDAQGKYCFKNLYPGEYNVKQIQPQGWIDGKDSLGKVGSAARGELRNDEFSKILMRAGEKGVDYHFGEFKLSRINGYVHTDNDGNCVFDRNEGDRPIAGVKLELLDKSGNVLATTFSDQNGSYRFDGLLPGDYSIRQIQPEGYFTAGEKVGNGGGQASRNLLQGIKIHSDETFVEYNFCEVEPSELGGRVWEDGPVFVTPDGVLPSDYRDQRDGIYDPNSDRAISGVRLYLYHYITVAGDDPDVVELSLRPVTLADVMPDYYSNLNSANPNSPIWTETGPDGLYLFRGLKPGSYVVQQEQPEGYIDANNVVGTTTGFTFNSRGAAQTAPQSVLQMFSTEQIMNSIVNIQVQSGGRSLENNFTEVRVQKEPTKPPEIPIIPPIDTPVPRISQPPGQTPGVTGFPGLYGAFPNGFTRYVGPPDKISFRMYSGQGAPYTWHLSIINAGEPRHHNDGLETRSPWQQVSHINNNDWNRFDMTQGVWNIGDTTENHSVVIGKETPRFGMVGGTPLSGDFNGDGQDQLAIFKDGYWMIDMNSNGIWDEHDMLIKFGDIKDRPVVGDWDGDGKDDIGIYGPMWDHDPEAIAHEPGLPNPENYPHTRPKNVPPNDHEATSRARVMKLSSFGKQRADVVDHVFGVGDEKLIPVAGDWNGTGLRGIGSFKDGVWQLDLNGDGKFDHRDCEIRFGQAGDIPVVGDFNGDGIDQIAVFRAGVWIIDSNNNRELDATDLTFRLGAAGDKPVMGDWNGDGMDQPAVYRDQPSQSH
jgi:serine-aspartate repeat-containing protein C/D/E